MHSRSSLRGGLRSSHVLALAASALLTSASVAQQVEPQARPETFASNEPVMPSAALQALGDEAHVMLDSTTTTLLYDQPTADALWVRGFDFKARFDGNGAMVVPFFGSDAPRNFPLEFGASTVSIGGVQLDVQAASVEREGDTVRLDRGSFVEEYQLTNCSLEQRFVFKSLPAAGELAVRVPATSELTGLDFGQTLRFENDLGAIDYGQAFAIDADGNGIELDSQLVDGTIELRVPASFVSDAKFPLTIDPLITFHTVSGSTTHEVEPDVAYDVTTDRWCVVFSSIWSQTDYDCFARLATGNYTLQPGLITIDFTTDLWATPKIANNNATNKFLVACAFVAPSGLADVRGRFVDPATATTSSGPFQISPADGIYRNWPDVGGDTYDGPASNYFVVWQKPLSATDVDIEGRTVGTDGSLGPIVPIESSSAKHMLPAISNTLGRNGSLSSSVWTIAWLKEASPFDHDIYAAQVAWNGSLVTPMFPVEQSTFDETSVSVSTLLDPVGPNNDRPYAIVFDRDYGSDRDVIASVLVGNQVMVSKDIVGLFDDDQWYRDQRGPSVDSDGLHFVIGFSEYMTKTATDGNVFVGDYYYEGNDLHACELRASIGGSPADEQDVAIHSMAASGGPREFYLAVHDYLSANNGYDIIGAYYRGCAQMVESVCESSQASINCPCGVNGAFGNGCANSASSLGGRLDFNGVASVSNDTARFVTSNLPANVSCLFFQGSAMSTPFWFGGGLRCVTGNTIRIGIEQTDGSGAASYPNVGDDSISVKGLLSPVGGTRYYQAWYRDPHALCTTKTNLTNALGVTWVP